MNVRTAVLIASALCACGGGGGGTGGGEGGGSGGGATGGGAGGGTGGGGTGGGSTNTTGAFPDVGGSTGRYPQLLIDAAGVRHYSYETLTSNADFKVPFRYGECASGCNSRLNWKFTSVGDRGLFGSAGKLALNAQGKPRLVWAQQVNPGDPQTLHFASCEANCTEAASWTEGAFQTLSMVVVVASHPGHALAVDASGRVHLVYSASKLNYATCASNCTAAASWTSVELADFSATPSLVVTASGQVRLAYTSSSSPVLAYRSCESNCGVLASWSAEAVVFYSNQGPLSLRLDAQGRPRILYNQSNAGQPNDRLPLFAWCDSNCNVAAGWSGATVGLPAGDGADGLDLELDPAGKPHAALKLADTRMGILRCSGNCYSLTATWTIATAETTESIGAEQPAPLPQCAGAEPKAYWYPGEQAAVALDPVSGKLEVAHRTFTLQKCGTSTAVEGVSIPRYSGGF